MRVRWDRCLPTATLCVACCAASLLLCVGAAPLFGQLVEAPTDEAPPPVPADVPDDSGVPAEWDLPAQEEPPVEADPLEPETPLDEEPGDDEGEPGEMPPEPAEGETPEADETETAPVDSPAVEEPDEAPVEETANVPAHQPASLDGVRVGNMSRAQLYEAWGKPQARERIAGGSRETFHVNKLGTARVTLIEDVVATISVHVETPLALSVIVERLAVDEIEPVDVLDEAGELLGAAYPPAGVLLGFVPQTKPLRVFQIVIEPINAESFLARAEARLPSRYGDCLADVEEALLLAPPSAQSHRLRAEVSLRSGDLDIALAAAQAAIELEPRNLKHRLLLAQVLAASGDYTQAIARVREVIDEPRVPDVVVARAWCLWGDYLSHSATRDYARAIQHHQQAIRLAEPLVRHDNYQVRRAAQEILVDAHLAVAYDIGWGNWQQKSQVVPKWVDRAAAFADGLLANDRGEPEVYLHVYARALDALAGIADPPDPTKWLRGIHQHGKRMYDEAIDPAYRAHLAWQMALALSSAVEIETARHQAQQALSLSEAAQSLFDESSPVAGRLPIYNYQRGRLCYLIGAVYAIEREDHMQAVAWFDRAAPLLEKPVPAAAVDAGTQGETFVSMAVSYWEDELRREALRLTRQGLKLMERAVGDGALETTALAIPYSNLASMHETLGEFEEAKKCAELAARYEADAKTK